MFVLSDVDPLTLYTGISFMDSDVDPAL